MGAFHRRHERLYTFAQEDTPVELVTLRVDALGILPHPQLPELPPGGNPGAAIVGHQPVALAAGRTEAPTYDRARLGAGDRVRGPAILTQLDATTLLLPAGPPRFTLGLPHCAQRAGPTFSFCRL
jgi:N-methylhydantoinase A